MLGQRIDVLFHAPWGLAAARLAAPRGQRRARFLENYGGGWQELFPSAGDPCTYRGRPIPFHGEVAIASLGLRAARTEQLLGSRSTAGARRSGSSG